MRLFSALQETNPPPRPQAFSCSGSSSEGSKTAAGVRLFGLHQRGRRRIKRHYDKQLRDGEADGIFSFSLFLTFTYNTKFKML